MQLTQPRLRLPGSPSSTLGFYGADLSFPFAFAFALPLALAFAKAASLSAFAAREGFLWVSRARSVRTGPLEG